MNARKTHKQQVQTLFVIALGVGIVGALAYTAVHARQMGNDVSLRAGYVKQFPNINESELAPEQAKIVSILRAEFTAQPPGTKYSQGVSEPWCADFVSWVMKEAGLPFINPNSGSWRIPGTMTLRDYFVQNGNWHPYGDGYVPKTGDIAIYNGNGPHGQHTNFVINSTNGTLTTIGGNEAGAIRVQEHALNDNLKVIGFAELQ